MGKFILKNKVLSLIMLLLLNIFKTSGQNCPLDKGYETEYASLSSQLGNLKEFIDVSYCKQTTVNQTQQEIFAVIKKKKPILNEDIVVSFEITFKTKSQKEVIMKGTPEFKQDQFIRQGWGKVGANQDMQLIIDENSCYGCETMDIISATVDDISIQINSGTMKDSILKWVKPVQVAKADTVENKLGGTNRFSAPPPPSSPKLPFDTADYRQKVNDKIQEFQENIRTLSNSKSRLLIDNTISQTLKLFIKEGEDVTIEVSSKKNKTGRKFPIAQYLNNLTRLKYSRVEITWTKIYVADNFYKGTDGNYWATVTFDQIFRGINDNVEVYSDVTRKKIDIQLKTFRVDDKLTWDVFLGSTTVEQTSDF